MFLATVENDYPDKLRADFQEFYSLNIDGMGAAFSYSHAAVLCVQLPNSSRVKRTLNPDAAYGINELLLREIEFDLRVLVWMRTKDAQRGANQPKRIPMPSESIEVDKGEIDAQRAYVDSVLNMRG